MTENELLNKADQLRKLREQRLIIQNYRQKAEGTIGINNLKAYINPGHGYNYEISEQGQDFLWTAVDIVLQKDENEIKKKIEALCNE